MVSTFSIPTNQTLSFPSVASSEQPCPRKVPLYICLGESSAPRVRLTDPAEVACAETVASYLSAQVSRAVALSELEGLSLYLWSEDEVDGRGLVEYSHNGLPLQALLLNTLGLSGDRMGVETDELVPYVGQRFVFASEVPSCA